MKKTIICAVICCCHFGLLFAQKDDPVLSHFVDSLIKISRSFTDKRDFDNALSINAEAEKIVSEKMGLETKSYGACCHNHGRILDVFNKDKKEAERYYLEAIRIRRKVLGKEHPDYGSSIFNLGSLYGQQGKYDLAEPLILEAKDIFEKNFGKVHPYYAQCLNNLGIIKLENQDYENAENFYLEAKKIREDQTGKNTPEYCGNLVNLGKLYFNMTYYEKSEKYLLEAKEIFENHLKSTNHPFYNNAVSMLSIVYSKTGQFEKAEPLLLQNKAYIEKSVGKTNEMYAGTLNNLAMLYTDMGNFKNAEDTYKEAAEIKRSILGDRRVEYANTIQNLAILYGKMEDYPKAEKLLLEVLDIIESNNLTGQLSYSICLNNLGSVYLKSNEYENSVKYIQKAISIEEKSGRTESTDYANFLMNLGFVFSNQGKYEDAEVIYLKAIKIIEMVVGKENPEYELCLSNLACLYLLTDNFKKAEPLFIEMAALNQKGIEKAVHYLSENELQAYLNTFTKRQNYILTLAHSLYNNKNNSGIQSSKIEEICFNNSLYYKGFLLNLSNQMKRVIYNDSISLEIYYRKNAYLRRLTSEYAKSSNDRDNSKIVTLESQVNELEKLLANRVNNYKDITQKVNWKDVQLNLKNNEAAIEFVHYRYYNKQNEDSIYYGALVLKNGDTKPIFIPLCDERTISSFINTNNKISSDIVNALYGNHNKLDISLNPENKSIYELLWKPLEDHLRGITTIYYSSSGLLHRINLSAIPVNNNESIANHYKFVLLNSSRELINPTIIKNQNNWALLMGGINFDSDTAKLNKDVVMNSSRSLIAFNSIDSTLRGGSWNYLLGSEKEIKAIGEIINESGMNATLLKGYDATEESFKNLGKVNPSPRILHIATHGYFFPNPKTKANVLENLNIEEIGIKTSEQPMIRSGLILANANRAWKGSPIKDGTEDGILTAFEIKQMNLTNTELVVLSACETGLGDIYAKEGVYGLQRAFKIAGVKNLIMSLWQIPDKQTSILMTTFYKKWLKDNLSIHDAFYASQNELKDFGLEPYQWAGFVLLE